MFTLLKSPWNQILGFVDFSMRMLPLGLCIGIVKFTIYSVKS